MSLPQSAHFKLQEVASGVFAAISAGTGAGSNAGIIDLGGKTIIFDAFTTPTAALDLLVAARTLTGREPAIVVNSHYHGDHVGGNMAFSQETLIISTAKTKALVSSNYADAVKRTKTAYPQSRIDKEAELEVASEPELRKKLEDELAQMRTIEQMLPSLVARAPEVTFEQKLTLSGSQKTAQIITYGGGHTASDCFLYLPEDKLLFIGDLIFYQSHPYLADGDPDQLVTILTKTKEMPVEQVVPGHGAVGTGEMIDETIAYVTGLKTAVSNLIANGGDEEAAAALPMPEAYANFGFPDMFENSLRFFYQRLSEEA